MASHDTTRASSPRAQARRTSISRHTPPPRPPRWRRWLSVGLKLGLLGLTLGVLGLAGGLWYFGRDLPDVNALRGYDPPQTTRVLDRDGELVGEIFVERRTVIPMSEVPREMVLSVLAAEDADFYEHEGFDYRGIARALYQDVITRRAAQGASTITQQVVKLLLLTPERTIRRKVRELILARRLEQELTKDEILWLYLNHINFGQGRYGVQEASRFYFGKDASALTLAEASLLAGIPQSPTRLNPFRHPEAARKRQAFVLGQLESKRDVYWPDLSLEELHAAQATPPELVSEDEEDASGGASEVMTLVRSALRDLLGEEAYRRGGYTVHTTIDLDLQRKTRAALVDGLEAIDQRHGYRAPLKKPRRAAPLPEIPSLRSGRSYDAEVTGVDASTARITLSIGGHPAVVPFASVGRYNPKGLPIEAFAEVGARVRVSVDHVGDGGEPSTARLELGPEGAVVLMDPETRELLALVGAYASGPGFNRATQALRQPGSTFKPLVYAEGIRQRIITPATQILDAPAVYDQWMPSNYETWRFSGAVRTREALARSINLVAVRVMEQAGPPRVVELAKQLGIESELDASLALSLGASEVKPIEMVNAYATFAAMGRYEPPRFLRSIEGPGGESIPLPDREAPRDVLTPAEAYVVTNMLTSVVTEGTASGAASLGRPVAGKTGTSNDARDAWFVGYTAQLACGVWVGFDDHRPLGRREGGGRSALPIFIGTIRAASKGMPVLDFPQPSGVVTAAIDPATGLLAYDGMAEPLMEVFLDGTVPTETSRPPDVAAPEDFLMEQFGAPEAPAPEPGAP